MRSVICGANGTMGKLLQQRLEKDIVGLVSVDGLNGVPRTFAELGDVAPEMVFDFSHHTAIFDVTDYAVKNRCGLVVATTGHTEEEKAAIYAAAKTVPVFYAGNMSLGIAVLCSLAKQTAQSFPDADIEIVEIHHNRKVDAPSGTAKMLFEAIKEARPHATANCGRSGEGKRQPGEVGISALRMGNIVGIHEVHITTASQQITLRHEAFDRGMFADGAAKAGVFLQGKPAGLYNMTDLLEEN
ncbi:MAG: 4-hydroxy-tetrahydrodipicolinate reductase [Oscillospiraceae bacterium]|nr:4-hydroxy-tetrahydrodipicolinate reductase [Oscillospiraceae bacterium]